MLCAPVNISEGYLRPEADDCVWEKSLIIARPADRPVLSLNGRKLVSVSAWWDPSFRAWSGDRSVLAIVYTDEDSEYWLHHLALIRVQASSKEDEATLQCRQSYRNWSRGIICRLLRWKQTVLGKFLPGILRRELSRKGLSCAVREMTSNKPKVCSYSWKRFDVVLAARSVACAFIRLNTVSNGNGRLALSKSSGHDDYLDAVYRWCDFTRTCPV